MKILLISTRFAPHVGGVERVVESLAKEFSKDNEVCVVTSLISRGKEDCFRISTDIQSRDSYKVKRIWMNLPRSILGILAFPYRFTFGIYGLARFVKSFNPDVINFHFPDDSSVYIWTAMLFSNKSLIINIHGNDLHVFSKRFGYKFFISRLLNKAKIIIVNSKYMKTELIGLVSGCSAKILVIANGLDVDLIKKITPKRYLKEKYIFFVGRFVHKKGIDVLIKAFNHADIPDLHLILEGPGEELANIKDLIRKCKLEDKVTLTNGLLSDVEKFEYMKGAVIGVIPSRIEPFGIVALEYLASGVPLIASKTGGLKSILRNNKTCLFFKNQDVNDLSEKIQTLYNDSKLREKLVKNGYIEVENYRWEEIAAKYLACYNLVFKVNSSIL